MKKLLLLLAVCATAVVTQAATYNWSMDITIDSGYSISGVTVFFTETLTLNDAGTLLNSSNPGIYPSSQTGSQGLTYKGESGSALVYAGTTTQLASTTTSNAATVDYYLIVEYRNEAGNNYSWTSDSITYDALIGDLITNQTVSASFKVDTSAVPEPTSGLLLLCGLAGLALRRKRA